MGGGQKSTWRTCLPCLSLYEYLMQGTKTGAVNSEKVWQLKTLGGERLTTAISKQNAGRAASQRDVWGGGGGRGRESTRECVEAWQGRQTGNLYIHTHVCIIREMLEKSELDVRGTHVQAYMDPIWEYNLILMFKTSQVNPVLSFFSSSNLQIFP